MMKITDIAFAVTLSAMLLASIAAIGSLGLRPDGQADSAIPVLRLEPVVITGTKASRRASSAQDASAEQLAVPCPRVPERSQQPV